METCSPLSGSESFELQPGRVFNGVISRGCHEAPNLLTWQICDISPTGIARRAFSLRPTDCPQGHQLRVSYWVSLALVLGRKDKKPALAGTHDAHEFRLFWLQVQENTTSGPKQALMGESVAGAESCWTM